MEGDSSQSTSPSKKDRDATVEAVNHLIQGKRHLLVQDYNAAVNSLQEAVSLLVACYGDLANECGDAYYHYGRALLELSRKESGVFGNSKDDSGEEGEDDDDDDEDEENENENEVEKEDEEEEESGEESKSSENSETKSEDLEESKKADEETVAPETEPSAEPKPSKETEIDAKDAPSAEKEVAVAACSSTSDDLAQPGPSGEQKVKKDEEVSNLQVAWEVLELAKIIFKRQAADSREHQLRLAQVYSKLGEVAMESENYDQSKEDLEECLKLQIPLHEKDDRELAETYYQLGLVYTLSYQYDSAIASFQMAINTIDSRIENLNKIVATNAPPNDQGDDPVFTAKLELAELQELLPELQEKIADTIDSKKNTVKVAEELKKDFVPVVEELLPESKLSPVKEVKPISNIGHLVRKKRKPEDNPKTEETSNKKIKTEVSKGENGELEAALEINNKNGKCEDPTSQIKSDKLTPNDSDSHVNGKTKLTGVIAETNSLPVTEG